jgi:hypothetical protein
MSLLTSRDRGLATRAFVLTIGPHDTGNIKRLAAVHGGPLDATTRFRCPDQFRSHLAHPENEIWTGHNGCRWRVDATGQRRAVIDRSTQLELSIFDIHVSYIYIYLQCTSWKNNINGK